MKKNNLPKYINRNVRIKTASKEALEEILASLTSVLQETIPEGEVVSIITYDFRNKRINCYGQRIDENLFTFLNMSMMVRGTRTTGTISYPDIGRLASRSYQKGYFIPLSDPEAGNNTKYAALVNIKVDFEDLEERVHGAILYQINK